MKLTSHGICDGIPEECVICSYKPLRKSEVRIEGNEKKQTVSCGECGYEEDYVVGKA